MTDGYKSFSVSAAREHLLTGQPLTRLEANFLFGLPDLTKLVSEMRRDGFFFERGTCTYAAVIRRLPQGCQLLPPKVLPVREVMFTEYRVKR